MEGEGGYLKKIKEFGTHVTEFSDSEKARMREATRPVYKVAEGIIGKDLIDKAGREIDRLSKK